MGTKLLFLVAAVGYLPVLAKSFHKLVTELASVQEEIVNVHNAFRRRVAPPASNMLTMNWSEEAAQNARTFSKYCDDAGSSPLERRITGSFCGENTHMASRPVSWSHVIETWYNESKYFKYGKDTPADEGKTTDHYTQVVWATSFLIGCGVTTCHRGGLPQYFYVCHYCHEGNNLDTKKQPYQRGAPCGNCPKDCEDKLCTNPCPHYDEYTYCEQHVKHFGCNNTANELFCKATCLCNTEIR
ncbi:cysteine-rich secretory protein 1 [Otolemur garnettii]|nr:cysteine-rich secretory protein 1 [Otolemur garnettii]